MEVPPQILTIIKELYKKNEICVQQNGMVSDWFRIISDVKWLQCVRIPVLDCLRSGHVKHCGKQEHRNKMGNRLEDLEFAEDTVLMASKFQDIQQKPKQFKNGQQK